MPRFVVLTHDHPFLHWDFMLERDGILRTWRLSAEPDGGRKISAEALPDHRLEYLDYEGPLSGDRGEVRQWDKGEYELIQETPQKIEVQLTGEKLRGRGTLILTDSPLTDSPLTTHHSPPWLFTFQPDETGVSL